MYLKSVILKNYRRFGEQNNTITFVHGNEEQIVSGETDQFNIAVNTTLLVGKNNAGKTTVISALKNLANGSDSYFDANDFNIYYLRNWIYEYQNCKENKTQIPPSMEFKVLIGLDHNKDDLIANIADFLDIDAVECKGSVISIIARYENCNNQLFFSELQKDIESFKSQKYSVFEFLIFLLKNIDYKIQYYNENSQTPVSGFALKSLMSVFSISSIHVTTDSGLSKEFNGIIRYRIKNKAIKQNQQLESTISNLNEIVNKDICDEETKMVNEICRDLINDNTSISLSSKLSSDILLENFLQYEYAEDGKIIPENHFGLGYSNVVMIIAEILKYIEQYSESAFNSKINLICIEEPETHLHPQMQELFINNINHAIKTLLGKYHRNINTQLVISTHSSHILNSKIQEGQSFNDIDFLTGSGNDSRCINIHDNLLVNKRELPSSKQNFNFVLKHITLGMSEMFFADAVILVEGFCEYQLVPYWIKDQNSLNHKYISIVSIGGAHAFVYDDLLKKIGIPVVIFTDLDIKRDDKLINSLDNLTGKTTSNQTILHFLNNAKKTGDLADSIDSGIKDDNIMVLCGTKTNGFYPSSFEEAVFLENFDKRPFQELVQKIHPRLFGKNFTFTPNSSCDFQQAINDCKSTFSSELEYNLMTNEAFRKSFVIPEYIRNGLSFLTNQLH